MCDRTVRQVGIDVKGEPTASDLKNHLLYPENGAVDSPAIILLVTAVNLVLTSHGLLLTYSMEQSPS